MRRKVVRIDEAKCNGCGLCVPSCAEGAIQIIDGKARLVSETYCDGLGACLGQCPQDAIWIEEREAAPFDAEAAERHVHSLRSAQKAATMSVRQELHACPSATMRNLQPNHSAVPVQDSLETRPSCLGNWPVQLSLVPLRAPYFQDADLVIAADCVPFTFADFHRRFLNGRTLMIGCPKLDNVELYRAKLSQIFAQNDIRSIEVVHMEVPCCFGLVHLARLALTEAHRDVPLTLTKIGLDGKIKETSTLPVDNTSRV